jgi:hypothetical protein
MTRHEIAPRPSVAKALGAAALGALAVGAVAIGAVVIGRLAVGKARVRQITPGLGRPGPQPSVG